MTVKCTGSEWNSFYNDDEFWPEDAWWDSGEVFVNGTLVEDYSDDSIRDSDVIKIVGGIVYLREEDNDASSLETHFRRWKKQQSVTTLLVEVPKAQAEAIMALIRKAGGKVKL